jgi:hypothetical protein
MVSFAEGVGKAKVAEFLVVAQFEISVDEPSNNAHSQNEY